MPWSLNIGKVGGTEIRIHVTFLLFLAWIWAVTYMSGGANAAWSGLLFMVLLFLCVLVHEYGHILAARAFGVSTRDVTLLPIGGVARLERFPEEPREEFLIAIAGPMVNVAIVLALMLAGANPNPENLATADITKVSLIDRLAAVNVVLAVFNLDPGLSHGRRQGASRAARPEVWLRPRHGDRRQYRSVVRLCLRLHRTVLQSDADLHRDLYLSCCGL